MQPVARIPRVSVVVPLYNKEAYVRRSLGSLQDARFQVLAPVARAFFGPGRGLVVRLYSAKPGFLSLCPGAGQPAILHSYSQ